MTENRLKKLPAFVSLKHLERVTGRSPQYILKRLPKRQAIHPRLTGWPKETVVRVLRKHPEMIAY